MIEQQQPPKRDQAIQLLNDEAGSVNRFLQGDQRVIRDRPELGKIDGRRLTEYITLLRLFSEIVNPDAFLTVQQMTFVKNGLFELAGNEARDIPTPVEKLFTVATFINTCR